MNREEILAKSRKENEKMDEREKAAFTSAGQRATAVGGLVCVAILLLNTALDRFGDPTTWAVWAVYLSMTGTTLLAKYAKLKKRHELIFGCVQVLMAAAFLAVYVKKLLG